MWQRGRAAGRTVAKGDMWDATYVQYVGLPRAICGIVSQAAPARATPPTVCSTEFCHQCSPFPSQQLHLHCAPPIPLRAFSSAVAPSRRCSAYRWISWVWSCMAHPSTTCPGLEELPRSLPSGSCQTQEGKGGVGWGGWAAWRCCPGLQVPMGWRHCLGAAQHSTAQLSWQVGSAMGAMVRGAWLCVAHPCNAQWQPHHHLLLFKPYWLQRTTLPSSAPPGNS